MSDIAVANSTYSTGTNDTASTLVNNVTATDAQQWNGVATAVVGVETILGTGTTLKGSMADLVERLSIAISAVGRLTLVGTNSVAGMTTDYGVIATSATQMTASNHTPVGTIVAYGGAAAPSHWLLCDGSAVNRTTYAKLFTAISTAYGVGDGSTTFNLPDLRGRVPMGVDGAAARVTSASTDGANADTLGGAGGAETHTLTIAQMPAHTHTGTYYRNTNSGAGPVIAGGDTGGAGSHTNAVSTQGGGGAHSNTQPWQTVNFIIFAQV